MGRRKKRVELDILEMLLDARNDGFLNRPAAEEIKRLREDVCDLLEDAFREIAGYEDRGDRKGWWDSMARSTAVGYGDRLVELGKWERHPDGAGRRWWYRSIE